MRDLIAHAGAYRAYADWRKVGDDMAERGKVAAMARALLANVAPMRAAYAAARALADAYPDSDGARVLKEMLEVGGEQEVLSPALPRKLKRDAMRRKR